MTTMKAMSMKAMSTKATLNSSVFCAITKVWSSPIANTALAVMVVSFKEKAQWNLIKQADIEVVADSKNQGCGVVADAITV